jgi:hypothetical protein
MPELANDKPPRPANVAPLALRSNQVVVAAVLSPPIRTPPSAAAAIAELVVAGVSAPVAGDVLG